MDSFDDTIRADERRWVLEMLQRGQISAAEADEVMAALEVRSATEERRASGAEPPLGKREPSVPALLAAAGGLARALAAAVAALAFAVGRVVGALSRLSGRARPQ